MTCCCQRRTRILQPHLAKSPQHLRLPRPCTKPPTRLAPPEIKWRQLNPFCPTFRALPSSDGNKDCLCAGHCGDSLCGASRSECHAAGASSGPGRCRRPASSGQLVPPPSPTGRPLDGSELDRKAQAPCPAERPAALRTATAAGEPTGKGLRPAKVFRMRARILKARGPCTQGLALLRRFTGAAPRSPHAFSLRRGFGVGCDGARWWAIWHSRGCRARIRARAARRARRLRLQIRFSP